MVFIMALFLSTMYVPLVDAITLYRIPCEHKTLSRLTTSYSQGVRNNKYGDIGVWTRGYATVAVAAVSGRATAEA